MLETAAIRLKVNLETNGHCIFIIVEPSIYRILQSSNDRIEVEVRKDHGKITAEKR